MALRTRLFLVLGVILTLSLAAQAWMVRTLSIELIEEIDSVAFVVGTSVAQVLAADPGNDPGDDVGHWIEEVLIEEEPVNGPRVITSQADAAGHSDTTGPNQISGMEEAPAPYRVRHIVRRRADSQSSATPKPVLVEGSKTHSGGMEPTVEIWVRSTGNLDEAIVEHIALPSIQGSPPGSRRVSPDPDSPSQRHVQAWFFSTDDDCEKSHDDCDAARIHSTRAIERRLGSPPRVETARVIRTLEEGEAAPDITSTAERKVVQREAVQRNGVEQSIDGEIAQAEFWVSSSDPGTHSDSPSDSHDDSPSDSSSEPHTELHGEEESVRLHLASHSGSSFLLVEKPDLLGRVPIPQRGLEDRLRSFQRRTLLGSAFLLMVGLLAAAIAAHRVSAPLRRLAVAASQVGAGGLGLQIDAAEGDREIRHTLKTFNHMSSRLAELDERHRRLQSTRHLGEIADIARGLAHSLRNPLNALGLSVEELAARSARRDGTAEDTATVAETEQSDALVAAARRQIDRLDQGIRSFLLLASPAAEDGLEVESVDVVELVQDVGLEALQSQAGQDSGGAVLLDIDVEPSSEGMPPDRGLDDYPGHDQAPRWTLEAVAPELRAVIQALVVNAMEASPGGETVSLRLGRRDPRRGPRDGAAAGESASAGDGRLDRLWLSVLDRGPGLDPELREKLFTPHVSTKESGSGMGLFLAHRIASHHYGGSVELLDREGGGTHALLEIGPRQETFSTPPGDPGADAENPSGRSPIDESQEIDR